MISIIYQAAVYVSNIQFQLVIGLHISGWINSQVKIKFAKSFNAGNFSPHLIKLTINMNWGVFTQELAILCLSTSYYLCSVHFSHQHVLCYPGSQASIEISYKI